MISLNSNILLLYGSKFLKCLGGQVAAAWLFVPRPFAVSRFILLATVKTCSVKNCVNFSGQSLACLCSATWLLMTRFMACKSGTTKILKPHTHLTIGILLLWAPNFLWRFWSEQKLISWIFFLVMPIQSRLAHFLICTGASNLLFYSSTHIRCCDRLGTITMRAKQNLQQQTFSETITRLLTLFFIAPEAPRTYSSNRNIKSSWKLCSPNSLFWPSVSINKKEEVLRVKSTAGRRIKSLPSSLAESHAFWR